MLCLGSVSWNGTSGKGLREVVLGLARLGGLAACLSVTPAVAGGPARPGSPAPPSPAFNGSRAFEDLKRLVAFGPRPSGSKALDHAREWMIQQLKQAGWQVEKDSFTASTPLGDVPMTNVIAKLPGPRPQVVILAGHYDTKRFETFPFLGANDGGSSAAFLLEMARVLKERQNRATYWLVFFDGEEAVQNWSPSDSLYGSRHLVAKLTSTGELSRIEALILVDMIGDSRLNIYRETNSTRSLREVVLSTAQRLGYARYFSGPAGPVQDDHIPFLNAGVKAVDLIDLDYGPQNSLWHTAQDTPNHCSPTSLSIVGQTVLGTLDQLERSW